MRLGEETITVVHPGTLTDGYGDEQPDWSDTTEDVVDGCSVQPRLQGEETDNRQMTVTGWTLFAPPGAPVAAVDHVEWDGLTLEVVGEVAAWRDRKSRPHHVEAALQRVTG